MAFLKKHSIQVSLAKNTQTPPNEPVNDDARIERINAAVQRVMITAAITTVASAAVIITLTTISQVILNNTDPSKR